MDINDIKGPETREEYLLNDPRTRGPILTSIAREVLIGVFARIETISTAVPHGEAREGLIQRQIYFKPTPKDKDIAVKKMIDDVLANQITKFVQLPNVMDLTATVEGGGIVIRCSVELFPRIKLCIDYAGYK